MQIIKKDISWLFERVPDFSSFYEESLVLFSGGYLAGGFLRKMVLMGSYAKALASIKDAGGDIDFFYLDKDASTNAFIEFSKDNNFYSSIPRAWITTPKPAPNSVTGFAYEGTYRRIRGSTISALDDGWYKYQLIYRNTGTPEEVLNRFDISNCKIATDGKTVWMVEDWEELEQNKQIRIDNYSGKYLLSRLSKYLNKTYSVYPSQKEELLLKMLQTAKDYWSLQSPITPNPLYADLQSIKRILKNEDAISIENVLLFYNFLGNTDVYSYNGSSLDKNVVEDYALHMFKKRLNKSNDSAQSRPNV